MKLYESIDEYEKIKDWEFTTYGEKLREWSEIYGDRVAAVEGNEELTYLGMKDKCFAISAYLIKLGIKKGDRIIIQLPNSIEFIISAFALFEIGAIPIMLLPAHREKEIEKIIELSEPVVYITKDVFANFSYGTMADELCKKCNVNYVIKNIKELSEIHNPNELFSLQYEKPTYKDAAMLLLSGGTTGVPKLIPRTHGGYIYTNNMLAKRCKLNKESIFLVVLPAPHNFPWGNPGILGTLGKGGKVIMSHLASPDEVFPLIEKHGVTFTALVPSLISIYLEVLEWDDTYDISSLEFVMVGGSVLEKSIAKKIMPMMKCKLVNIYGLAEGLNCCTSLDDTDEVILTTQGKAISEFDEIIIVDENNIEVPIGEFGEVITRGPYTFTGYYRLPEVNKDQFTEEGFFCTGDKARITEEGDVQVVGRVREQINRAGEKIVPSEVEEYICEHEKVRECIVIGIPDKILGFRSCACVITDDECLSLEEVREYLRNKGVTEFKIPDQLEIIDFWPLTAVNKVDKDKLVQNIIEREKEESI